MASVSRRNFISATAAVGLLGYAGSLGAKPSQVMIDPKQFSPEGIFTIYQSNGRAMMVIRSTGRVPIPLVFDTGTNGNAIDIKVQKLLHLKRVPNHVNKVFDGSTGKSFDAFEYVMPDISIGSMKIGDRQIAAYPYDSPDEAGIFGPNLFFGQLVYVDLGSSRVRVMNKASFDTSDHPALAYIGEKGNSLPSIEILLPSKDSAIAGFPAIAKLDSGNNRHLSLPISYIDQLPLMRPPTIVGRATSVSGTREVMGGQINGAVKIGSVTLMNPEVTFDGQTPNVGLPVIRQLRVLLDPEAEQGWLLTPVALPPTKLAEYAGQYGIRRVFIKEGQLVYHREGGLERMMTALGGGLFDLENSQDQVHFEKEKGLVTKMILVTSDGNLLPFAKSGMA